MMHKSKHQKEMKMKRTRLAGWTLLLSFAFFVQPALAQSPKSGLATIRNLDYTIILCEDIEKMRRFYSSVMQFEIFHEVPGQWVEFRVGSSLLTLRPRNRPYDGSPISEDTASVQLAFRVPPKEVNNAFETLKKLDVRIIENRRIKLGATEPCSSLTLRTMSLNCTLIFRQECARPKT